MHLFVALGSQAHQQKYVVYLNSFLGDPILQTKDFWRTRRRDIDSQTTHPNAPARRGDLMIYHDISPFFVYVQNAQGLKPQKLLKFNPKSQILQDPISQTHQSYQQKILISLSFRFIQPYIPNVYSKKTKFPIKQAHWLPQQNRIQWQLHHLTSAMEPLSQPWKCIDESLAVVAFTIWMFLG